MRKTSEGLAEAVLGLQRALGETQEGMARRLGCTLGAYSKWVRGERTPGGTWPIKLITLCPDAQTRARVGADIGSGRPKRRGARRKPPRSEAAEEVLLQY